MCTSRETQRSFPTWTPSGNATAVLEDADDPAYFADDREESSRPWIEVSLQPPPPPCQMFFRGSVDSELPTLASSGLNLASMSSCLFQAGFRCGERSGLVNNVRNDARQATMTADERTNRKQAARQMRNPSLHLHDPLTDACLYVTPQEQPRLLRKQPARIAGLCDQGDA